MAITVENVVEYRGDLVSASYLHAGTPFKRQFRVHASPGDLAMAAVVPIAEGHDDLLAQVRVVAAAAPTAESWCGRYPAGGGRGWHAPWSPAL